MKLALQLKGETYLDQVSGRFHELADPLASFAHENWIVTMLAFAAIWALFAWIEEANTPDWVGALAVAPVGVTLLIAGMYVMGGEVAAGWTIACVAFFAVVAALAWIVEGIQRLGRWLFRSCGT